MSQELSQRALFEAAAEGLRRLAADPRCRAAFAPAGSVLREVLAPASLRYVMASEPASFLERAGELRARGYRVTAAFAAPDRERDDPAYAERVVDEYLALLAHPSVPDRFGLDLFGVGLAVSHELAVVNTGRIAAAAAARGSEVVLAMDRSPTVDAVLAVHRELADRYENVGLTLQAQLHRTARDAAAVARPRLPVRLVKGAFGEAPEIALGRGPALEDRYLELAGRLVDHGVRLSLATQDPQVLASAEDSGLLDRVFEIEMLYGVRPRLLRRYRDSGRPCRVHAAYGTHWWQHLLERLAEHPPMVLSALADIGTGRGYTAEAGY
ncbi:hypothetical protein OG909_31980 [Streptomyces sp. NBC_01754]|uniref:proline dehydrogenase family protein n=1 Tax=Streptomyces sp. NBC_01754 TaxID=2975930 RepID=UPI002DDA1817|nr:proline dehydrogenase family protein [Streptomyces sp. NBC_01754]WSC90947.1 hypothetical protein OG909_00725 [Streptomyces sp. NBC_01754]WSC96559.1 hypothetical protein OG909_31980 [Streptomyces sp. NBC_01754]